MISQHDKAKRWRPRFSIRTLVIVVTLVCAYFGLWEATKRWGCPSVSDWASSPAPLIVVSDEDPFSFDDPRRVYYV